MALDLYSAIEQAETGHLEGDDKWIRTQVKGSGSSAYGPVQINKSALTGIGYDDVGFSEEEHNWIQNTYLPQMDLFLEHGGEDMTPGNERYDYGGKGDFTEDDRDMYKNVANKLMNFEYKRVGGDMNKFIHAWRGESEEEDPRYYNVVNQNIENQTLDDIVMEQGSEAFISPDNV